MNPPSKVTNFEKSDTFMADNKHLIFGVYMQTITKIQCEYYFKEMDLFLK